MNEDNIYEPFQKKTEAFISSLEDDIVFLKWVKDIREKYKLSGNLDIIDECGAVYRDDINCDHTECNVYKKTEFHEDIDYYVKNLGLGHLWNHVIDEYVLHGEWGSVELLPEIYTEDINGLIKLFEKDDKKASIDFLKLEKDEASFTPMSIRFTSYSTERDLLDYVRARYKTDIEPLQKRYRKDGVMFGKARRKDPMIKERNQFIYENRDKTPEELMSLVREKFGKLYDYAYISSILSKEKKKRK